MCLELVQPLLRITARCTVTQLAQKHTRCSITRHLSRKRMFQQLGKDLQTGQVNSTRLILENMDSLWTLATVTTPLRSPLATATASLDRPAPTPRTPASTMKQQ